MMKHSIFTNSEDRSLPPLLLAWCALRAVLATFKQQARLFWLFHFQTNNKTF